MIGAKEVSMSLNVSTVKDGRGGIFTFLPKEPIVEINLVVIKAGHFRGEHYHKEFVEYFLIVSGLGLYVTKDEKGNRVQKVVSGGEMFRVEKGTPHVVYAIENMRCISALSKKWDDCDEPITYTGEEDI